MNRINNRSDGRDSLHDGPVGFDAGDGRVLGVDVADVSVGHLGSIDHQTNGGVANASHGGGSYADYLPIGASTVRVSLLSPKEFLRVPYTAPFSSHVNVKIIAESHFM